MTMLDQVRDSIAPLRERLVKGGPTRVVGSFGSSTVLVTGALARDLDRPVVLIVGHLDEADTAVDELRGADIDALLVPALEVLPGESAVAPDLFAERLEVLRRLEQDTPRVLVCPIQALMQGVPTRERLASLALDLRVGAAHDPGALLTWLTERGYRRSDAIEEPGDVAVRGGIIDVFPTTGVPIRLDFFGDEIESIHEVDIDTLGSDSTLEACTLVSVTLSPHESDVNLLDVVDRGSVAILAETMEIVEQGRGYFERVTDTGIFGPPAVLERAQKLHACVEICQFMAGEPDLTLPVSTLPELARDAAEAVADLHTLVERPGRILVTCQNAGEQQRLRELVSEFNPDHGGWIDDIVWYVHRGFIWNDEVAVVPYHELLHRYETRRKATRIRSKRALDDFVEFGPGDHVVHADHGIARFLGMTTMKPRPLPGRPKVEGELEYLTLEFAGSTKLHVPAIHVDQVQRYIGGFQGSPPLSHMGGAKWKTQKERVAESVRDLAAEMLRVRAARESLPGIRYPEDTPWQREFEAEFPYQETEDQLAALAELKRDMQSERPMDRLICGDVGFGKTEVAIRAAFKAVEFGKQVAFLVPTTVLAEQHERTLRQRFADYPFRVESLSRFKTGKEINATLASVRKGQVDIVVGTHRLLSKDVRFADLGLVIIDEEQRFGVEHKEKLLQLRTMVDVMTLSATPIPRTLHMAMLGLRDISNLTTPPLDRRAIVTEVIPYNATRIKRAIERELSRDGQIYFVHNRVHNIRSIASEVQAMAPEARIVIGHGQMPPRELEKVMLTFMRREADILVATTIIESGIDIATANTMFVNECDLFGLADLHQLRGRVGRYKHRAYCYMLLPRNRDITNVAKKRLRAIEQNAMLGAGFKIAMRDLEIRGAGNLLGAEQSGHIAAVGYEMYCQLLEQQVRDLRNDDERIVASGTTVEIGLSGLIPKAYIPSDARRLEAYRRLATSASAEDLDKVREDIESAYGQLPGPVEQLMELADVRIACARAGCRTVTIREKDVVVRTPKPDVVADLLREGKGIVTVLEPKTPGDLHEVFLRLPSNYLEPETLGRILMKRLAPDTEPSPA